MGYVIQSSPKVNTTWEGAQPRALLLLPRRAQGAVEAAACGYAPLPETFIKQIEQYWTEQMPVVN